MSEPVNELIKVRTFVVNSDASRRLVTINIIASITAKMEYLRLLRSFVIAAKVKNQA